MVKIQGKKNGVILTGLTLMAMVLTLARYPYAIPARTIKSACNIAFLRDAIPITR